MIRNGPPYIGSPILGGTSQSMLYVDANGKIAQDNAGLSFDPSTDRLTVAGAVNLASAGVRLSGSAGVFTLAGLSGQQENLTFDLASTANTVAMASGSGVTSLTWTGSFTAGGILAGLGLATAYVTKTGDYTLTDSDDMVELISNAGTFTMPTAVGRAGRLFCLKNAQTANALTVSPAAASGQTFDGAGSLSITNGGVILKSDNANWRIVADLGLSVSVVDGGLLYGTSSNGAAFTAAADLKWDNTNKYLGLSQTTPKAQLHLTHAASGYSEFTDVQGTSITPGVVLSDSVDASSYAGASTIFRGFHAEISVAPASNASRTTTAGQFFALVPSGNSTALSSYTLQGSGNRAEYKGTGSIGTIQGSTSVAALTGTGAAATTMIGMQATATKSASGAVTSIIPINVTLTNSNASGTVAAAYGIKVADVTNAGTFTETYGLHIGLLTGAGTHTNKPLSIWTTDFNAWSMLRGLGSVSTTSYGVQFLQDDVTRGSHHYISTGNNPILGSSATPRNQAFMGGYAQTDTGNDYFNYIFRGGAKNSDAGTPYKELFEMGVEGNYSDAGSLSNHHWYLWDFPASKLVLTYGYSANEFAVSEAAFTFQTSMKVGVVGSSKLLASATAPTVSSGFGTSPSIAANNGSAVFTVNVGTGGTASAGVIGMPTAATGWVAHITNVTANAANRANERTVQTASSTTSISIQNQLVSTGAAQAWTAGDVLRIVAFAY